MSDGEYIVCQDCGLRYTVVFTNDGCGGAAVFCPRCGSTALTLPESEDDAE